MAESIERPPVASAPLSVILFAHALSTEVPEALRAWRQYLDTLNRPCEIFLIQETRPEVPPNPADAAPIAAPIFTYERSVGLRAALDQALRAAQRPLLVFCPCDKQYHPCDLDRMLKMIDKVDLVVGYRAGGQAPVWRVLLDLFGGVFRRVILGIPFESRVCWLGSTGWGRRLVARWIFGVHVVDPECPFRLARREVFTHLPIQSGGPFSPIEMLAKANHLSCLLAEEPVTWTVPTLPASDAISFAADAWHVFREPDFGPPAKALANANAT